MAVRKITKEELKQMNLIIRPRFGAKLQIEGGSYETTEGASMYHLFIGDPVNTISHENLTGIGETLKKKWDSTADYYSYGKKISK